MPYFLSIFLGTFVLEDLALASSLALMADHKISLQAALLACFLGISIGDLGLYFLGYTAAKFGIDKHFKFFKKYRAMISKMKRSQALTYSIVVSRVIPGTRLPTYLAAGFLKYPFFNFLLLTIVSVFPWVLIALIGGKSLHYIFMDRWFLSLGLFLMFLQFLKSLVPRLADPWQRKAMLYTWRKWLDFEFWPAWLFYIPIVPYYAFLGLRCRSLLMPFYASPQLKHGGLIGESKWDLVRHLNPTDASTLKTFKISKDIDFIQTMSFLEENKVSYPFIMKPDVGQRGFGVRIIKNDFDLTEYLLLSPFDRIIQNLSTLSREAGVFYIRKPSETVGKIFSITDKKFPFVVGDGQNKLGDLILNDVRARIISPIYFSRLNEQLNSIPAKDEIVVIAECGNHCQGAIFENGERLISEKLTFEIDRIAKQVPDFYFGRFDIRYKDEVSLKQGLNFEIVEINGSGSEATHIWDSKTRLLDAYKTLFIQWSLLFSIGTEVSRLPNHKGKVNIGSFLKDCAKVIFRKDELSVSS